MNRHVIALLIVILINCSNTIAFGCGAGGYRPPVRVHSYRAPQVYHAPQVYRAPQTYRAPQVYHAPVNRQIAQQPVQTIPTINVAAPRPAVVAPSQASPVRLAPTQQLTVPTQPPVPDTTPPSTVPVAAPSQPLAPSAQQEASALALLMGEPTSQTQTPQTQTISTSTSSTPSTPSHLGTWRATTRGQATVTLTLNSDSSFNWVANNQGKSSQFSGTFTLSEGKLTLARSSDNQKLTGDFAFAGSGFNFKLAGAKDNGLNFAR